MPRRRIRITRDEVCTDEHCNVHWEEYLEATVRPSSLFAPAAEDLEPHPRSAAGMPCYCRDANGGEEHVHTASGGAYWNQSSSQTSRGCHGPRWVDGEGECQHPDHDAEVVIPEINDSARQADGLICLCLSYIGSHIHIGEQVIPRSSSTAPVGSRLVETTEVPTPTMPRPTYEAGEVELIPCAYVERQCLRRDRDGNVPARDENGRQLTEYCSSCDNTFCTQHRHLRQNRPENYCHAHGMFHPRCMMTTRCDGCDRTFCEGTTHEAGGDDCGSWLDEEPQDVEFDTGGYGGYGGPYREAELLFEGDNPVAGLAEGKRYIAFELEEELRPGASGAFTLPEKFGITTDGSLRDNGIEVTFPPSRQDALVENVRTAVDALLRGGYNATSRCGMHTHIDLRDKVDDPVFLSRLFATFYAVEDILFAMQSNSRVNNSYCAPLRQGWKFYDTYGQEAEHFDFVFYKMPKTVASKLRMEESKRHKGGNRYNAFNFLSVWYRGSLEVRLHEGCLNARTMLMWAELLQKIVQRVEDGITYPTLRKLVDMPVSPEKLALFGRVFKLSDPMLRHVQERIETNNRGQIAFRMPNAVILGTPKKGRAKSILPRRRFNATHRMCRWCGATVTLDRRCSYCRREPFFSRDEFGMADQRVMRMRGGTDEYGSPIPYTTMTEDEFNRIAGVVTPATRR